MKNPFSCPQYGPNVQTYSAEDRRERVRGFSLDELEDALKLRDLQKSVRAAVERRIRKLKKRGAAA